MSGRRFVLSFIGALALLPCFTAAVYARDDISSMRCGNVIAEIGAQINDFEEKCGAPTATEEGGRVWIYDRRPDDFVYYVTVVDGQVERIQVGDGD